MKKLLTTATLLLTGGLMIPAIAPSAQAQTDDRSRFTPVVVESIPRRIERAFFQNSGDFYFNRTIPRQVQFVFGVGYPENEIQDDANLINGLYRELSDQQNSRDPILRSPDIRNPYDTSIQALPNSTGFTQGGFTLETPSFR
jgi:hypothetical protein